MLEQFKKRLIKTMQFPTWYKLKEFDIEVERTEKFVRFIRYSSLSYKQLINAMVRKKYDIDDELAVLRQKDTKIAEYNEYFNYVEECKAIAKEFIDERVSKFGK